MTPIPLSLYIHFPWCVQKCPYCDFNSHQANHDIPEERYISALLKDLEQELPYIWGRRLESVFIGGGTPSLISATGMERLMNGLRSMLPLRPSLEMTMEANPGTFEQERFQAYRETGINRLSIGIQSYNSQHLQHLGRIHDSKEALKAAEIAKQAGFDNFNLDLMFGLSRQSTEQALDDLQQAINCQPSHLSWYQLTIEPNTLFHHTQPELPIDDAIAAMQEAGQQYLAQADYQQYEVSAYARNGNECQHNKNYWEFGDYVAIGAGAHGKLSHPVDQSVTRYFKYKQPKQYMESVESGIARTGAKKLTKDDLAFEFMLNALRLKDGFHPDLFEERTKLPLSMIIPALDKAASLGLITQTDNTIKASSQGWLFLNELLELFLEPV